MRYTLLVLALAGCATSGGFEKAMNSHLGSSEGSLVSSLGPPQNVYQAPDGSRVLTWSRSGNMQLGGQTQMQPVQSNTTGMYGNRPFNAQTTTYQAVQAPVYNVPLSCTVNFTIANDSVVRWSAQGNHCVN